LRGREREGDGFSLKQGVVSFAFFFAAFLQSECLEVEGNGQQQRVF